MKKLWLVSALSLGLVLLAGCNNTTPAQNLVEVTSAEDMMSMYNESKSITCNMDYSNGEETSTIYIKDDMISQEIISNVEWEEGTLYRIARDGKMYIWGSVYGENVWISTSYEVDMEEELWWFDEMDDSIKVSCAKWVKNNSVFDLPTDVEFTSMDDLYDYVDDYVDEYDYEYLDEENNEVEENNEEWNAEVEENVVEEENVVVEETVE